jgi:hypothetical protein
MNWVARKRLRIRPQPPIDRWAHPTGERPKWVALLLVCLGLLLIGWAARREHDVFGDGALSLSEWRLTRAVTVGGPRRPAPPPSDLDLAIQQFLGDQAGAVMQDGSQDAFKSDEQIQSDFCPT